MSDNKTYVYISLKGNDIPVGTLWFHNRKGKESASFEYDKDWLKNPERFALEPALNLTEGVFHTQNNQTIFGSIGDSAPDRWGRVLMRRAETLRAKESNEIAKTLTELDYLLGVNDYSRQGALRFSQDINGKFLSHSKTITIPPLIDLPKLLSATERYLDDNETKDDLKLLLAPGSSLGGARPKASVRDKDGNLYIAKFPRKDDDYIMVAWEAVALTLAKNAGIQTPEWKLEKIADKPVLIIKRFDRNGENLRIPFLSAMSMLGAKDNEAHSYLEIAYAINQNGAHPENDLQNLWRRIVFSVLISNTDDHLRNHGFIYENSKGWSLSPVYDVNPTPTEIKPRILSTSINFDDPSASLDIAFSVISDFRISKLEANKIVKEVSYSVLNWREVAKKFGISKKEIDFMSSAFEHSDLQKSQI